MRKCDMPGITVLCYLLEWWGGGKKRIVSEGENEGNWSIFNNRENGFPYFICVIAIISI